MMRICVVRLCARLAKSLSVRRMNPYIIMRRIETNTYDLDIPASMGIHLVFSVEDMTPYYKPREYVYPSSGDFQPPTPPLSLPYHPHSPPMFDVHHYSSTLDTHLPGDSSSLVLPTAPLIASGSTTRESSVESTETIFRRYIPTTNVDDI